MTKWKVELVDEDPKCSIQLKEIPWPTIKVRNKRKRRLCTTKETFRRLRNGEYTVDYRKFASFPTILYKKCEKVK